MPVLPLGEQIQLGDFEYAVACGCGETFAFFVRLEFTFVSPALHPAEYHTGDVPLYEADELLTGSHSNGCEIL